MCILFRKMNANVLKVNNVFLYGYIFINHKKSNDLITTLCETNKACMIFGMLIFKQSSQEILEPKNVPCFIQALFF